MDRERLVGYLFLAPVLLLLFLMTAYPIGRCIWASVHSFEQNLLSAGQEPPEFLGLEHYREAFSDPRFTRALWVTVKFTLVSVACEFVLGLVIALVLARTFRGRGLVRAAVLVPWALPPALVGLMWLWAYNDQCGVVNDLLMRLGIIQTPRAWLGSPKLALGSLIVADVWKTTPFICIILLAGLHSIPRELYEAISIDGAGPVRRFFLVTLPLLRPYILLALLFRTIQAFGVFDLIWVSTQGGPGASTNAVALYIYRELVEGMHIGYASALTVLIFAGLFSLALVVTFALGRKR
jgi:multiple sugar transport system permease protein